MKRSALSARELAVLAGLTTVEDFQAKVQAVWVDMNRACELQPYDIHVSLDGGGVRTFAAQLAMYRRGRVQVSNKPAPYGAWQITGKTVTRALPGQSAHNFGAACDVALLLDRGGTWLPDAHPGWEDLSDIARHHGLETGKSWKPPWDFGHIQIPGWLELARTGVLSPRR